MTIIDVRSSQKLILATYRGPRSVVPLGIGNLESQDPSMAWSRCPDTIIAARIHQYQASSARSVDISSLSLFSVPVDLLFSLDICEREVTVSVCDIRV